MSLHIHRLALFFYEHDLCLICFRYVEHPDSMRRIMPKLANSLRDWPSAAFTQTLKDEISNLESGTLPLDKGVSQGGYVDDSNLATTVLHIADDERAIHARVGIFFTEIVGTCGCGGEPMLQNAYCEMRISIDKVSAEAQFSVMQS